MLIWWKTASLVPLAAVLAGVLLQSPPFRSRTDLVALNVTVVDDKGVPVGGLSQDSFTVTEDGRPQPIAQFASDPLP